jgi:hypothetical protein
MAKRKIEEKGSLGKEQGELYIREEEGRIRRGGGGGGGNEWMVEARRRREGGRKKTAVKIIAALRIGQNANSIFRLANNPTCPSYRYRHILLIYLGF